MLIEYTVDYTDTSEITLDESTFLNVSIYKGSYPSYDGDSTVPQIPSRILVVGVPSEYGNTLKVLNGQYETLYGEIIPSPKVLREDGSRVYKYEIDEDYLSYTKPELVTFGDYGLFRDLPIQKIIVNPVQYDPSTREVRLYTKIRFRINYGSATGKRYTISDELDGVVLNPTVSKNWGVSQAKTKSLLKTGAVESSVLSSGTWYRFEAPEEGIYKISQDELSDLGIDAGSVDPRTIKIYNNGGYQLAEDIDEDRPEGLEENAILVEGEEDGSFDSDDYILFYGRGTDFFEYDTSEGEVVRYKHDFSQHNYYYITSGGDDGKRMESRSSLSQSSAYSQTTTKSYLYHEEDEVNIGETGREYFGEIFNTSTTSRTFINSLAERVSSSTINYNFRFANTTSSSYSYNLTVLLYENDTRIYSGTAYGWGSADYYVGRELEGTASYSGELDTDGRSVLKIAISNTYSSSEGYLDYFEIEYERSLSASDDDEFIFYSEDRDGVIEYDLSDFSYSSIEVYDITDHSEAASIEASMISGGEFIFQDEAESGNVKKYLALTQEQYKSIEEIESVSNSDLRGITDGAEYVIITVEDFSTQAERLATYRSSESAYTLTSEVVYLDELYNEFSCGSQDPTAIRDFLAYAYNNWTTRPELALLFGDGDYDYFDVLGIGENFIPTYQTEESLYEINSYPSDDYYSRISGDDGDPDIGIGRIPVDDESEAEIVVDKIIYYEEESEKGLWRDLITLVADDGVSGDDNDGSQHTGQSEDLANNYIPAYFNQEKIYLSAYETVITSSGRRKPAVNQAIIDAINNETLIVNFIGHGSPSLWAHENVFVSDVTIPQLNNEEYFFLTAATCDFGRYDVPDDPSGTELMLIGEDKGIIGGFCSSRSVYSNNNADLNEKLYTNMFEKEESGLPPRIGTAYMYTKIEGSSSAKNDRKFHLFGDPAIRLNQPVLPASIDSVNSSGLETEVQISALGTVTVKGSVQDLSGDASDFDGEAIIAVYDCDTEIELEDINYTMTEQGGVIFKGRVTVEDGSFETEFTVPKDISYENENGKIIAYIYDDDNDGIGYTENVIVGGSDSTATDDGEGPEIEIYFDDLSFESTYLVNSDFNLLVRLEDETGINTTGTGVGHKLEAVLDEDEDDAIDLTSYFTGDLDAGGKSGLIDYNFSDVDEGDHEIELTAWDIYNNVSTEETYFTVVNSEDLVIRYVVNYPNPFSSNTTFTFQQNLNKSLNVRIKIYTIAGRLIKEIESDNILDKFVRIPWDGRDEDGSILANGTYLYKLIVESTDGDYKETVLGKMAVLR